MGGEGTTSGTQSGEAYKAIPLVLPMPRELYYYHPDYLGNVEYITNMDGEPYQYFLYTPWGEALKDEQTTTGIWKSPYQFNLPCRQAGGKELDENGLYYYGARYYNPSTSVWLSVDPLSHLSPNQTPYHFVNNNPIVFIDPDGRIANPVYDLDGNHLGNTSEGFTGEVLIYTGDLNDQVDFSQMTSGQLLNTGNATQLTSNDGAMSDAALGRIYTHIANYFDGSMVLNHRFELSRTESGQIGASQSDDANFTTVVYGPKEEELGNSFDIQGHRLAYEYTVENIRATMIGHEYFGHGIRNYGDATNDHWKAYQVTARYIQQNNIQVTNCYRGAFRSNLRGYLRNEYYSGKNWDAAKLNRILNNKVQTIMGWMP
jgi:RHS repeat-associated protein